MKKLFSLFLISAVLCTALITLYACGQDEPPLQEEENPPREEKAPPKEKEEETPPEEETQPEEGVPIEPTDEQQQLIGKWKLMLSITDRYYDNHENGGYAYTFKPDGSFVYENDEVFFNFIKDNDSFEIGECHEALHTFWISTPDKVHGTFQFPERERADGTKINTVVINIACKGEKRLYEYRYEMNKDKQGNIHLWLDSYPAKCFEPCIDVFKKITE